MELFFKKAKIVNNNCMYILEINAGSAIGSPSA